MHMLLLVRGSANNKSPTVIYCEIPLDPVLNVPRTLSVLEAHIDGL
jgi:hypothetical protein